jgi:hypothetical protein
MKRNVLVVCLAFSLAALSYAGDRRGWKDFPPPHHTRGREWQRQHFVPPPQSAETVTVTGNLGIVQGAIALTSDGTTYYVPILHRYAGFIDGLKEGAAVTLTGRAISVYDPDENLKMMMVTKLTINGKDYDLTATVPYHHAAPFRPF